MRSFLEIPRNKKGRYLSPEDPQLENMFISGEIDEKNYRRALDYKLSKISDNNVLMDAMCKGADYYPV